MTIRQDYLMLALAAVLLVTNCLGAIFTIRRNRAAARAAALPAQPAPARGHIGWSKIYGRFAVAQGITVAVVLAATALTFSHAFIKLIERLSTNF